MMATTLIVGATGNVGGALARELAAAGVPARALVRHDADLPPGIEPVRGDLADPPSLDLALDGTGAVFLVWPNGDPAGAEDVVARLAGRRVAYLSMYGADDGVGAAPIARMHGRLERLVREHAGEWSLLRAGGFAANTLGWADQVREGRVRWPYGEAGRSLVHEDDLAAVARVALTTDRLVGAAPHLTGPETLTQRAQVQTIGEVLGLEVEWEELSRTDARDRLLGWGWPTETVDGALDAWAAMVASPEIVSSDIERVLGRPAIPFAQWVRDHATAFRS
jgi:uncharacterized protein YbjT (DUF2867 family)